MKELFKKENPFTRILQTLAVVAALATAPLDTARAGDFNSTTPVESVTETQNNIEELKNTIAETKEFFNTLNKFITDLTNWLKEFEKTKDNIPEDEQQKLLEKAIAGIQQILGKSHQQEEKILIRINSVLSLSVGPIMRKDSSVLDESLTEIEKAMILVKKLNGINGSYASIVILLHDLKKN